MIRTVLTGASKSNVCRDPWDCYISGMLVLKKSLKEGFVTAEYLITFPVFFFEILTLKAI